MRWRNALLGVTAGAVFSAATSTGAAPLTLPIDTTVSPIQHVVIIDQENHSFDNVIGKFCSEAAAGSIARQPCDGATVGYAGTSEIPLATSPDVVSTADHSIVGQQQGINGGLMNGFFRNRECRPTGTPRTSATNSTTPLKFRTSPPSPPASRYRIGPLSFEPARPGLGTWSWRRQPWTASRGTTPKW